MVSPEVKVSDDFTHDQTWGHSHRSTVWLMASTSARREYSGLRNRNSAADEWVASVPSYGSIAIVPLAPSAVQISCSPSVSNSKMSPRCHWVELSTAMVAPAAL